MTDTSSPNASLLPFRNLINKLDNQLLEILSQRFSVCAEVARHKNKHGIAMMQPDRVAEVKARCAKIGAERGLRREFTEVLYALIIGEACRLETTIIDQQKAVS
ncbi:chorismate mutase [Bradyrhizobium canariense]|uniref:chorismate mutase n=1 Tax=Bradyrhizobium canariense TaxID=255045 RepID=UPI000A18CCFE|nr:chorismate mutase [Bradyrhizobium canariense]OSI33011.1 4-amino-4-deoxychorismate mutase [Bradyrhizobium canariense]OSI36953.1 4-amino-4-deoxychorismate mutase [Bradyrhizobium canariense]OSI55799.1 4-amino-4-deoxychorismate mutase [Bradyrhizobium canariense]OSI57791.1 4-amino-4-deoxychorismate mutase [Bradyrhizobium canariense]OSI59077.1 4-amino-4-deoxychorismate mutase [Bradyrhizobium canariense]